MDRIVVGIAEGKIAVNGAELISYALGSCVGICLFDRKSKIAGMAHIILPEKAAAVSRGNAYKFADEGLRELLRDMAAAGAVRKDISAKIAGGAKMFETGSREWDIGLKNVTAVKAALTEEGIALLAEDTGKNYGRTILFSSENGSLTISTIRRQTLVL